MGSLKEFLEEQAGKLQTMESEAARKRDEWLSAVNRLNDRIEDWLQQADAGNVLKIQRQGFPNREEQIGQYVGIGLVIDLGPNRVRVEPVARFVAGPASSTGVIQVNRAYGRVDLTNGLDRFMIFRTEKEPEDRWSLIRQDDYSVRPFDQQSFEAAFQSLLA